MIFMYVKVFIILLIMYVLYVLKYLLESLIL